MFGNMVTSKPDMFSNLANSASFCVTFNDKGTYIPEWMGKKYLKGRVALNLVLLTWINHSKKNKIATFYEVDEFYVHLEYMRNGVFFWCHPNFKSNEEWYDWVMVQFDSSAHTRKKQNGMWSNNCFPSKLMCFFVIPHGNTIYAVIHSTHPNDYENNSILFRKFFKFSTKWISPILHVVDVSTF